MEPLPAKPPEILRTECSSQGFALCFDALNAIRLVRWIETMQGKLLEYDERCGAAQ